MPKRTIFMIIIIPWMFKKLFWKFLESANDMKIFIVLSESPLKVRKIAIYRFLISFLGVKIWKTTKKWYEKCAVLNKINHNW